jgi:hypothetical protein
MGLPCFQVENGEKMSELPGDTECAPRIPENVAPFDSKEIGGEHATCSSASLPTENELVTLPKQGTCTAERCELAAGDGIGKEKLEISAIEISHEFDNQPASPGDVVVIVKCSGKANSSFRQRFEEMRLKVFKKPREATVIPKTQVPFFQLFMFADWWDHILIMVGTIGACAHGVAVPVFFLFFGDLIDSFGANYNNPDKMGREVSKVNAVPFDGSHLINRVRPSKPYPSVTIDKAKLPVLQTFQLQIP